MLIYFPSCLYQPFPQYEPGEYVHPVQACRAGKSCCFSSNWVKTGKNNSFWSVINDQINSSKCLKRTMLRPSLPIIRPFISSFGQINHGNCCFCNMVGSTSLDCKRQNLFSLLVSFLFCSCIAFFNHNSDIMSDILLSFCLK